MCSAELTVDISLSEMPDSDIEDVPETALLEKWVLKAYFPAKETIAKQISMEKKVMEKKPPASVSLRITGMEEIQQLNMQFRHKNKPTNVLSFSMPFIDVPGADDISCQPLGDIVLCAPVIKHEAQTQNKTPLSHWAHMIVHGMLHLQGYDHIEPAQAKEMERLEVSLLNQLGYPDPYQ